MITGSSSEHRPGPQLWAVVPAAGTGTRVGAAVPKQYLNLLGRPVLVHTLARLCSFPGLSGLVLGLAPGDRHWPALQWHHARLLNTYLGAPTRAATVLAGLDALDTHARADDWVLVHDAVRPCVRHEDIARVVAAAEPAGALLALAVTDTLKRADGTGHVAETVARADLWRALTPQVFRFERLRTALRAATAQGVTDEAAAMERLGDRPRLVPGAADNIKITLPADMALAEMFLERQAGEAGEAK